MARLKCGSKVVDQHCKRVWKRSVNEDKSDSKAILGSIPNARSRCLAWFTHQVTSRRQVWRVSATVSSQPIFFLNVITIRSCGSNMKLGVNAWLGSHIGRSSWKDMQHSTPSLQIPALWWLHYALELSAQSIRLAFCWISCALFLSFCSWNVLSVRQCKRGQN